MQIPNLSFTSTIEWGANIDTPLKRKLLFEKGDAELMDKFDREAPNDGFPYHLKMNYKPNGLNIGNKNIFARKGRGTLTVDVYKDSTKKGTPEYWEGKIDPQLPLDNFGFFLFFYDNYCEGRTRNSSKRDF